MCLSVIFVVWVIVFGWPNLLFWWFIFVVWLVVLELELLLLVMLVFCGISFWCGVVLSGFCLLCVRGWLCATFVSGFLYSFVVLILSFVCGFSLVFAF